MVVNHGISGTVKNTLDFYVRLSVHETIRLLHVLLFMNIALYICSWNCKESTFIMHAESGIVMMSRVARLHT